MLKAPPRDDLRQERPSAIFIDSAEANSVVVQSLIASSDVSCPASQL